MANETPTNEVELTGKDLFMDQVSDELLNNSFEVETEDSPEISQEETKAEDEIVTPDVKPEEEVDEDSEDDILNDLLGEDETDGEVDDVEEADSDISDDQTFTVKYDGEDHDVTLDELKRSYGQQSALTKKEMALAEQVKALESKEATLDFLKYQGEFAPRQLELDTQTQSPKSSQRRFSQRRNLLCRRPATLW